MVSIDNGNESPEGGELKINQRRNGKRLLTCGGINDSRAIWLLKVNGIYMANMNITPDLVVGIY